MAGHAGRQGALPRQRELHVLRQGPRRPPAAGDAAARAERHRRHRAGARVLPPARRDPSRPDRGDRLDARRRALLRPVLPARQRHGAATDATLRRPRQLPRPARADPRAGPAGRRTLQRHRRLPGRDRGRPADPVRLPGGGPDGRHRRVRLLRRGRHRGRGLRRRRQARRGRDPRPHRARHHPGRGAQRPARRGAHRRAGGRAGRVRRRRRRRGPGGPPGPGGRRYDDADRRRSRGGRRPGDGRPSRAPTAST